MARKGERKFMGPFMSAGAMCAAAPAVHPLLTLLKQLLFHHSIGGISSTHFPFHFLVNLHFNILLRKFIYSYRTRIATQTMSSVQSSLNCNSKEIGVKEASLISNTPHVSKYFEISIVK